MLEDTVEKRLGRVQRTEDSRRAKQLLHWIPDKNEIEVNHASPGLIQSAGTLWTRYGKMSVSG